MSNDDSNDKKFFKAVDSFTNFAAKVGVAPGEEAMNLLSQSNYTMNLITRNRIQLEAAYRGSWMVGAMVDSVAEDMTKAGVHITTNDQAERVEDFQAALQQLQIWNSLCDEIKWARLYGGAIAIMMIDGQDLASPLRVKTIQKGQFTGLAVYDRWQVYPDLTEVITCGPDIGLPAYYYIMTSADLLTDDESKMNTTFNQQGGIKVHHSRIIRQIGVKLPFWQAVTEMQWGMSELERILDRLFSFDNATMSSAELINRAHIRSIGVEGLREIISTGGKALDGLTGMFEMIRLLQSNFGLTILDKNDEYHTDSYSFAGLSDMMLQFGQQLSGASGIPLVRLFGQSPAGLNSTGESDLRNYYGNINAKQEATLRPGMYRLLKVAWKSVFGDEAPKDMQFKFVSLWQDTPTEKATVAKTNSETVVGAYESGLIQRGTAVKELRNLSTDSGLFTNITDEEIAESENDVPLPGGELGGDKKGIFDSMFRRKRK